MTWQRHPELLGEPEPPAPACIYITDPVLRSVPHRPRWAGWFESPNPEVAIPIWDCSCGERRYGRPRAFTRRQAEAFDRQGVRHS